MKKETKIMLVDMQHEFYALTDGAHLSLDALRNGDIIKELTHHISYGSVMTTIRLIEIIIGYTYNYGLLDGINYKKVKRRKRMKKVRRTMDVIKVTSPNGNVKYVPGNTPLKKLTKEYPGQTIEPCLIRATMSDIRFLETAEITEINEDAADAEEEV